MQKNEFNYKVLLIIFCIAIVIANVVGARVITTGVSICSINLVTSGAFVTYAITFLCTDIVGEIWGKQKAQDMVKYGFIGQVFACIMIFLTELLPAIDPDMDNAYHLLLGQNYVFVIGSLAAYLVSQSWDVFIFHKLRDKYIANREYHGQGRWIWNNFSTCTSQIIDTVIYVIICFGIGLGWLWDSKMYGAFIGLILGQYILKACLALLDTPIFYLLTRNSWKNLDN